MRRLLPLFVLLACGQNSRVQTVLPPGARIDVFPQLTAPQLDALFVVDNSRFMGVHEARVAQSFQSFTDYLDKNQMDYHLGLVTADVSASGPVTFYGGGAKGYIASTDGNAATAMAQAVLALGTGGSAISAVLEQANLALKGPPDGFLRAGAALFIVVVTDNGDPWSPPGATVAPFDDANLFYYRSFKEAKGAGNDGLVRFAAVAGPLPNGCSIPDPQNPSNSFVAQPAGRLAALVTEMNGAFENLCDPDFNSVFDQLGALGAGLKTQFRLTGTPDPATLQVTVRAPCGTPSSALAACAKTDDQCGSASPAIVCTPTNSATDGWQYDPATLSIVFTGKAIPPRASAVDVQYQDAAE